MFQFRFQNTLACVLLLFGDIYAFSAVTQNVAIGPDENESQSMTTFRLPNNTEPISYTLRLKPFEYLYIQNEEDIPPPSPYYGEVDIKILVKQPTYTVTLHSQNLKISHVQFAKASGFLLPVKNYTYDVGYDLLHINLENELSMNTYIVLLKFNGVHQNNMRGFYQSVFALKGQLKVIAATQFEPTYARYAFPCYDEPRFKTSFEISICRFENQFSLSNMPLKHISKSDEGRICDNFEITPKMPTYLVAFLVLDSYSCVSGRRFYVWVRDNAISFADIVIKKGPTLIEKMEYISYMQYPLPKMDVVAIPDFSATAMENYGLTTYRESRCLNTGTSTSKHELVVLYAVAHELAHQWFGDIVTPVWWDYLWLNEAFATYYGYLISGWVEPDWNIQDHFVIDELQLALVADGIKIHHPLTAKVNTPAEINSIFDLVTYSKGASILRMLKEAISEKAYTNAVRFYLKSGHNIGGFVTPATFYEALEDQVNLDKSLPEGISVVEFMKSWTEQVGYPLITVTRDYKKGNVHISQMPYKSARSTKQVPVEQKWIIPITYTTGLEKDYNNLKPKLWLTNGSTKFKVVAKIFIWTVWILLNVQEIGFYRVNYDKPNWDLIRNQLHNEPYILSTISRTQIVDDVFNLAFDEIIDFKRAFSIISYLNREMDQFPWTAASRGFSYLRIIYQETEIHKPLQMYFSKLISPQYNRVGLTMPGYDDFHGRNTRRVFSTVACENNLPRCVRDSKKILRDFTENGKSIPADMMPAVLCTAIRYGGDQEYNAVYNYYAYNQHDSSLAEQILPALGCSTNFVVLERLLEMQFVNKLPLRKQDHRYVLRMIKYSHGANAAFIVINKWLPKLMTANQDQLDVLQRMLSYLETYGCTDGHLKSIREILASSDTKNGPNSFSRAAETAFENIFMRNNWRKKHIGALKVELVDEIETTTSLTTSSSTETTLLQETTVTEMRELTTDSGITTRSPKSAADSISKIYVIPLVVVFALRIYFLQL